MQRAQIVVVEQRDAVEHVITSAVEARGKRGEIVEIGEGHFAIGQNAAIAFHRRALIVFHRAGDVLGEIDFAVRIAAQFIFGENAGGFAVQAVALLGAFGQHRAVGFEHQVAGAVGLQFQRDTVADSTGAAARDQFGVGAAGLGGFFGKQLEVERTFGGRAQFGQALLSGEGHGLFGIDGRNDQFFDFRIGHIPRTRFFSGHGDSEAECHAQHETVQRVPTSAHPHYPLKA